MAEEELQQQLILAAEIGKQLLESNKSLEEQLNKNSEEYTKQIEELEQGRYSLQMKIESKTRMELNYLDEIDNLKHTLKNQKDELLYIIEAEHNSKISPLRSQVTCLQCELEKSQLNCRQLQEQKEQVEQMLTETKEQLEQRLSSLNETCSEENAMLHVEVASLQTDKMNLTKELQEEKQKEPQWLLQVNSLRRQLASKEDEVEEKQCQATSYFNALEKSREEIQELKVQLDIIKMDSQNMKTKGNSLFSEVEDRRIVAEKQLITVQVQHEALKKKHDMMCQNLHKLKMQMAGLLQMSGAHADVHHMERMQQQLSQARSEIQVLSHKLQKHEKQEKGLSDHITDVVKNFGDKFSDKNYLQYLQALLKSKESELKQAQQEMSTKRLMLLAESEKVIQCERRLYTSERQLEKIQGQNMKLHLKVDEYRIKYEPDAMKADRVRRTKVERIPMQSVAEQEKNKTNDAEKGKQQPVTIRESWPCKSSRTVDQGTETAMPAMKTKMKIVSQSAVGAASSADVPEKKQCLMSSSTTGLPVQAEVAARPKTSRTKSVTISSEVDVIENSDTRSEVTNVEGSMDDHDQSSEVKGSRVRGRQRHQKTIKITKDSAMDQNECKTQ